MKKTVLLNILILISGIIFTVILNTSLYDKISTLKNTRIDKLAFTKVLLEINGEPLNINMLKSKQILNPATLNTEFDTVITNNSPDKKVQIFINDIPIK